MYKWSHAHATIALQPGTPRTFSQYFEMPFTIEDILVEFDCTIARQLIELPQSNFSFNLEPLDRELNRNRNRIELVNETARREALISPILFEVAELTNQRINVEYAIAVNAYSQTFHLSKCQKYPELTNTDLKNTRSKVFRVKG